jgi:hypothetical protein
MKLYTSDGPAIGLRVLAILGFLLLPLSGWAVLGDNAASVLADQAKMKGTLRSVDNQTYVLHEIALSSGAKVREFVSPAGVVFAVAWDGPIPPDFQQLLGPYYQQAQQTADQKAAERKASDEQQPRTRRAPIAIESAGLVFYQTGRPRSFHGQAYIPQLVPQGVTAADIR